MDYRMKRYVKQFRMLNNVEIRLEKKNRINAQKHFTPGNRFYI